MFARAFVLRSELYFPFKVGAKTHAVRWVGKPIYSLTPEECGSPCDHMANKIKNYLMTKQEQETLVVRGSMFFLFPLALHTFMRSAPVDTLFANLWIDVSGVATPRVASPMGARSVGV